MKNEPDKTRDAMAKAREEMIMGGSRPFGSSTRFKPGQSGNPRGRPRRSETPMPGLADQPTKVALLRAGRRKITVREGDRVIQIPATEALIQASMQTALKGSPYMQHRLLDIQMKLDVEEARDLAVERAVWEYYQRECNEAIKTAKAEGKPVPEFLPHPDDIVIDTDGPVRILGPLNAEDAKRTQGSLAMRDLLILQDEWDRRSRAKSKGAGDKSHGAAFLYAMHLDATLPPRLRLSEIKLTMAAIRAEATSNRVLLKTLYQGWRALDARIARGATLPDLEEGVRELRFIYDLAGKQMSGEWNASEMSLSELCERIAELRAEHGLSS